MSGRDRERVSLWVSAIVRVRVGDFPGERASVRASE